MGGPGWTSPELGIESSFVSERTAGDDVKPEVTPPPPLAPADEPVFYVGIGASAGGLEAIEAFFTHMPANSQMAFIVIQHLSPDYKSLMVELLSKKTDMPVFRAENGMPVQRNAVYLIPPKKNLTIFHGRLVLADQDATRGMNFPIDLFFRSLAEDQNEKAIAIVLSGTGSDGARGVRTVKENGGVVLVQDEESARFDGMPRAALATGMADFTLKPESMPDQLLAFGSHPSVTHKVYPDALVKDEDTLTRVFSLLRDSSKVDFTHYKPTTVLRRLERRMVVSRVADLKAYVHHLEEHPEEVRALYRDLLIGVTSFFRDPDIFRKLQETWLPDLLSRSNQRELRFWTAGCSTGEEAYSLAIAVRECLEALQIRRDVKLFATDIDKVALMTAGAGSYPEEIAADVPPKLLAKYFHRKGDRFQVTRPLREMVVFAQHNLLRDPPFTNIDLVSCRNLLIYFQPVLQQKSIELFNFSLNAGGLLFLGSSETVGELADYFEPADAKAKLFLSKGRAVRLTREHHANHVGADHKLISGLPRVSGGRRHAEDAVLDRLVKAATHRYLPTTIVVNDRAELVHSVGDVGRYFRLPPGRAQLDVTSMAPRELSLPLSAGIQKVLREHNEITFTSIRLHVDGEEAVVTLRLVPLPGRKGAEPLIAIFVEAQQAPSERSGETVDVSKETEQRIEDLERELQFTKENLQATIEELEASNEELQASNEELLASNEELQSTNEELQSTNEELHTVNTEHQQKIIELTAVTNDVENLLATSQVGTLLLDENLEIHRYSPAIRSVLNIIESDRERPLGHLSHRLKGLDLPAVARQVQQSGKPLEQLVASDDDKEYLLRVLPYQVGPQSWSGVVMRFVDVTQLRASGSQAAPKKAKRPARGKKGGTS